MRLGIDLMGSDRSPEELYEAVKLASDETGGAHSFFVFCPPELQLPPHPHITRYDSAEIITMEDEPVHAIRRKKNSSLVNGLRQLRKRELDGLVTAGNTGALIAGSSIILNKQPGIVRPALLALLPSAQGQMAVIDVGGNVSCKAHHLIQFAHLGVDFQKNCMGVQNPRVGLLNIGVESKKGTLEIREVHEKLKQSELNFVGNVEARDVFLGGVDVLVTDGFTGNVLLKTSEGVASFVYDTLKEALTPENKIKMKSFHYEEHPGAVVCGVQGTVIKCHGHSSTKAFLNGIRGALRYTN